MGDLKSAPDRELLLRSHAFPGEYVIKAFGPAGSTFHGDVERCAAAVVGAEHVTSRTRDSRGGRRTCVTLTLRAQSVDHVLHTYENLHQLDSLLLIL